MIWNPHPGQFHTAVVDSNDFHRSTTTLNRRNDPRWLWFRMFNTDFWKRWNNCQTSQLSCWNNVDECIVIVQKVCIQRKFQHQGRTKSLNVLCVDPFCLCHFGTALRTFQYSIPERHRSIDKRSDNQHKKGIYVLEWLRSTVGCRL